jgi:signal transduction histidine kinase
VISDILDFSKIEADRLDLESIDFDLPARGRRTSPAGAGGRERDIELRSDVEDVAGFVARGDPTRVRQVLLNLVGNAVKFTETGGVEVRVTVVDPSRRLSCDSRWIDTGIGISAEVQTTLFQPFVQADASTTRRFGGTGLGLAICQRFVTRMGGEIGLTSGPTGSTFWFTLPLGVPTSADDATPRAGRPGARVLVADDNPVNQRVASLHLERLGYEVDTVPDGASAVRAVAEAVEPYDAVFMDCHMPA